MEPEVSTSHSQKAATELYATVAEYSPKASLTVPLQPFSILSFPLPLVLPSSLYVEIFWLKCEMVFSWLPFVLQALTISCALIWSSEQYSQWKYIKRLSLSQYHSLLLTYPSAPSSQTASFFCQVFFLISQQVIILTRPGRAADRCVTLTRACCWPLTPF